MDQTVVTATTGRELGTRPSKRLRAEGKLPAVLYGLGKDPVSVAVDYAELRDALKTEAGMNTVLSLQMPDLTETAIVKSVQRDPIRREVTHVDFLRIDPDQRLTVSVPVHLVGEARAVLDEGGLVEQNLFELDVEAPASAIPNEIQADIAGLTLDGRISVGDLTLPAGVTTLVEDEVAVASPVLSRAAKVADDDGAADGEGAEDGGEAAAEAEE